MEDSARVARRKQGPPPWLDPVCQVCRTWKLDGATLQGAFEAAAPDLSDPDRFVALVTARLRHDPALIAEWQIYSGDKRVSRGPFLAGLTVGNFDGSARDGERVTDRRTHDDAAEACADFLLREAEHVLSRTHGIDR